MRCSHPTRRMLLTGVLPGRMRAPAARATWRVHWQLLGFLRALLPPFQAHAPDRRDAWQDAGAGRAGNAEAQAELAHRNARDLVKMLLPKT